MRNSYLVCYDISDEKRLRKVVQAMRGYGVRIPVQVVHDSGGKRSTIPVGSGP